MTQFVGTQNISAGVNDTKQVGSQGLKGVLIGNESGLSVVIYMDGTSDSKSLYPGTVDFFPITGGFSGTVKWKTQSLLNNVAQWPSSFLQFDTVGINEPFNTSVYPLTLPRLTNIGNNVNTNQLSTTLVNTGNPVNTQNIIQVSPAGDVGNTTTLDNMGNLTVGDTTHAGTITLDSAGIVKTNTVQDTSGDGVISVTGTGGTQNTRLQSGNQINLQVPGGTTICIIDSAGIHLNAGQLLLTDGAMKHFNGASTVCGSGTVISHGIGVTPRMVLGEALIAQPGSSNTGVNNFTATTFTASIFAGTNYVWTAWHE